MPEGGAAVEVCGAAAAGAARTVRLSRAESMRAGRLTPSPDARFAQCSEPPGSGMRWPVHLDRPISHAIRFLYRCTRPDRRRGEDRITTCQATPQALPSERRGVDRTRCRG